MPYVQLLADFREEVRNVAREEKGKADFIQLEQSTRLDFLSGPVPEGRVWREDHGLIFPKSSVT